MSLALKCYLEEYNKKYYENSFFKTEGIRIYDELLYDYQRESIHVKYVDIWYAEVKWHIIKHRAIVGLLII